MKKTEKVPVTSQKNKLRRIAALGMLTALSFAAVLLGKLVPPIMPAAPFLSYEPKDVIITVGGMLFGPIEAFGVTLAVSIIEMVTVSGTGPVGMLMNLISSCAFACTASVIYKKNRKLSGAVLGLISGVAVMSVVMVLWNYLITPLYMGVERTVIKAMLLSAFLPFNLIKGSANAGLTMLLYKPIVTALRASHFAKEKESPKGKINPFVVVTAFFVIAACVLTVLALNDLI